MTNRRNLFAALSALFVRPVEAARQVQPLPCPTCGNLPTITRYGDAWAVECENVDCLNFLIQHNVDRDHIVKTWNMIQED